MKLRLCVTTASLLLLAASVQADDKADLAKVQGDWKIASVLRGGKEPPAYIKAGKLNVSKNTFTMIFVRNGTEKKDPIDVKLDSSKSPKQIDFIKKDGSVGNHGIYKIDGKKLTLCFTRVKDTRPKTFESKEGSDTFLIVFERTK